MNTKRGFSIAAGLAVALMLSAGLNVGLYRFGLTQYRDLRALRLDPTAEPRFTALNAELAPAAPGQARIVFFGDSRIARWRTLPALTDVQQINRGRGGETTAQLLLRLERDVIALSPDIVVLQAGVNDLTALGALPWMDDRIVDACAAQLARLLARLRTEGIAVVVTTILPVGAIPLQRRPVWSDRTREAIVLVNEGLRAAARNDPGVHLLDLDADLSDPGRRLKPEFARDMLHLNAAGYRALNARLEPVLAELLADHGKPH